jgi:cell division protein FtsL
MKKPILFIILIIGIIVSLSIIQVSVSNSLATTGIELGKLEEQITAYRKENKLLTEQYLTLSSFQNIASQAADMGFVEAKSQIVLTNPVPIAAKP